MIEPMKEMAGFIVMVFPLAQFVAMFNWSNMGKFMAVSLTDALEAAGLSGVPAFVGFGAAVVPAVHVYCQRVGHLVDSGAHLCPHVYDARLPSGVRPDPVPCRRFLGDPAGARVTLRSAVLGFLQRYRPEAKLGTYYSLVLPYPLIFLGVWLVMLVAWYLVGLPIGPVFTRG